ncbi:MAG: sigma-70 family RNA polymerase sigma factor [Defluviitaleaceae bacterium]|nr:sigma-70 family RNA polymerase sigma factor [Defluviitaleaceae bacterium]
MELDELIPQYGEKLLRYATTILYSHPDAEDVVQDVFISYLQNSKRAEINNIAAWLYKVTYNLCLNKIKGAKRRRWSFFEDIKEEPAVHMEDSLTMPEIMEALKRLTPQERALLYGRAMDEHSYEELSHIIGASPAALRKQYERVKKKASKYLDAHGYGSAEAPRTPNLCIVKKEGRRAL